MKLISDNSENSWVQRDSVCSKLAAGEINREPAAYMHSRCSILYRHMYYQYNLTILIRYGAINTERMDYEIS
jgi:hypothetical protein